MSRLCVVVLLLLSICSITHAADAFDEYEFRREVAPRVGEKPYEWALRITGDENEAKSYAYGFILCYGDIEGFDEGRFENCSLLDEMHDNIVRSELIWRRAVFENPELLQSPKTTGIEQCIRACREHTRRSSEQCFDDCND